MDALKVIENLIGAIDQITSAANNSDDVSAAIEDAEDTANLAKVILPSLEAPAPAAPIGQWVVADEDNDVVVGHFPDKAAAEGFISAAAIVGHPYEVMPPSQRPHVAPQAPTQPAPAAHVPFANRPSGSLYRN
jgi:hypothetical protein